ncbi:MAG: hypothetical protein B6D46_06035 [Polyangiaceae bacterium UTPRO1]|jgi:hypothetical protein|nr:hypothetical protein [Myxococcales bacterium]OQY67583.1 MAG: hypothetical protein B6D46_06035 [Polyangiaceae bacterium UTPRO1]
MPHSPLALAAAAALAALLPAASFAAGAPGFPTTPLRGDPDRLCAPAAAVGRRDTAAWVVDAGSNDRLFGLSLEAGRLAAARAGNVDLSSIPAFERPHDVEAAATVVRSLLLVGSHARGERCEVAPERERILVAAVDEDGKARTERAADDAPLMAGLRSADERACLESLFNPVGRANEASRLLCRALVAAERAATSDHCETLAFAGAAVVVQGERERVWLALRTPLVDGKAALVRMAAPGTLRFDTTVLADLGGRGFRELAAYRRTALAIAAPAPGSAAPWALYELAPRGDESFAVQHLRDDLVPQSHALLATDAGLVVLVDGESGAGGGPCRIPAQQYFLPDPTGAHAAR